MKTTLSLAALFALTVSAHAQVCVDQWGRQIPCGQPQNQGWQPASSNRKWVREVPPPSYSQSPAATPKPWRCRVTMDNGDCGSGSLIGPTTVITNWHVVRQSSGAATCAFPANGQHSAGRVIATDEVYDLAIIQIGQTGIEPAEIYEGQPAGVLTAGGFGSDGRFRVVQGPITGWVEYGPGAFPCPKIRGSVRSGDSGGGVVDASKKFVGVLWGTVDGETYVTSGRPLHKFLSQVQLTQYGSSGGGYGYGQPQPPLVPVAPVQPPADDGLHSLLIRIEQRLDVIESKQGEPGPPGPRGLQGPPGPRGEADITQPIYLRVENSTTGFLSDYVEIWPGGKATIDVGLSTKPAQ